MQSHKKLGRLPRTYDQSIPHLSSLLAGRRENLPPPPTVVDRMSRFPLEWGMMANDVLGDCTCAALGHAVQLTSFVVGHETTPSDEMVVQLYEKACGYRPGDASTDQGGEEQAVLRYVRRYGIPVTHGQTDSVLAYIEIDARNLDDIKRAVNDFGFVYVGADIPEEWMRSDIWTAPRPGTPPEGGHAFMIGSYDPEVFYGVSWGEVVKIAPSAIQSCVVEAYAVVLASWFGRTDRTVGGLTAEELEDAMRGLA